MCARFTLSAPLHRIAELFDLDLLLDVLPRFNVAPTQQVLTVRDSADGKREYAQLRWGLVPSWATDLAIGNKLLNARSETVGEKPSFRDAFRKRRCLIAADGFYEWKTENKKKQPYHIHFPDRGPFAFAGIWDRWRDPAGSVIETCSILTTTANELLRPLHDRMPVILAKKDFNRWLNLQINKTEELSDLFEPLPVHALEMFAVTPQVNKPIYDEPVCIEPITLGDDEREKPKAKNSQPTLWEE